MHAPRVLMRSVFSSITRAVFPMSVSAEGMTYVASYSFFTIDQLSVSIDQACQLSWIFRESHGFTTNLTFSRARYTQLLRFWSWTYFCVSPIKMNSLAPYSTFLHKDIAICTQNDDQFLDDVAIPMYVCF